MATEECSTLLDGCGLSDAEIVSGILDMVKAHHMRVNMIMGDGTVSHYSNQVGFLMTDVETNGMDEQLFSGFI
jgi:hypothetical protein